MLSVTLRLWAVYVGSTAVVVWAAGRWIRRIGAAPAAFLILAPLLFTGGAMWTGGVYAPLDIAALTEPLLSMRADLGLGPPKSPVLVDVVYQGLPWQAAVRASVEHGRWPLWNPFVLAGEPLLATQQHGALHPTSWPGGLLPIAQAWTLSMTLRLFLALLCAHLYFVELGCGRAAALFGATAWAFSDFLVFFLGYPLNPCIGPFPLLLLGLRRLAREPGRQAAAITLAALLLMTTAGHPESVLHGVAGAGVYFLFELWWAGRGARGRSLAYAALSGALALGLSAVLYLPFREAAARTIQYEMRVSWYAKSQRSVPLATSLERSIKGVVPYAFGPLRKGGLSEYFGPAYYAGAVVLLLALAGLASSRREKWPFLAVGFLGLSCWMRLPVVNDAICRLPLFDVAWNEYLVAWAVWAAVALAVFGIEVVVSGRGRRILPACAAVVAAEIVLLFRHALPNIAAMPASERASLLAWQLGPLAVAAILGIALPRRLAGKALPAALVALLAVERLGEIGSLYPTAPARALDPPLPFLDAVSRREPNRIAALGYLLVPNAAAFYGLEDVRGYEAMTLSTLVETYPLWCVGLPVWFNRVDDPTKPFLSFLNVRYVIANGGSQPPPGWRALSQAPGARLFENPRALPRFFVPRRVYREPDPARQKQRLFAITDFGEEGVLAGAPSGVVENAPASVRVASYRGDRIALSIDAARESLIASSTTAWPGWRLSIDGQERPLLQYNRAFLAFSVPEGRHEAVLRYWPRSFVAGLWISGISAVLCVAIFGWPRRRAAGA